LSHTESEAKALLSTFLREPEHGASANEATSRTKNRTP